MQNPPNLQIAHMLNVIFGASPAYASFVIVGAPGPSNRLRIWACGFGPINSVTAASLYHAYFRPTTDPWRVNTGGAREHAPVIFEFPGGIVCPENDSFEISGSGTGGGRTFPTWVAYTIEPI